MPLLTGVEDEWESGGVIRLRVSAMWRYVVWYKGADVSEAGPFQMFLHICEITWLHIRVDRNTR